MKPISFFLTAVAFLSLSSVALAQATNPFAPPAAKPKFEPEPIVEIREVEPEPVIVPVAEPPKPVELREHIQAKRIGTVNGKFLYRSSDTYVFDDMNGRKLVKEVVSANSGDKSSSSKPTEEAYQGPGEEIPEAGSRARPSELPSMVGRPNPRN